VSQGIAVRVAHGTLLETNRHAPQDQLAACCQAMNVIADADAMTAGRLRSGFSRRHGVRTRQVQISNFKSEI
jgi:hypothetical protein